VPAAGAYASINRLIDVQAFTWAADDIFIGSAITFLFLIVTIWFTRRPPKIAGGPAVDAGGAH
jgi:DHA2 family multidrug resistance protein